MQPVDLAPGGLGALPRVVALTLLLPHRPFQPDNSLVAGLQGGAVVLQRLEAAAKQKRNAVQS